jgi:cytochrome b involved in lipid metabolism
MISKFIPLVLTISLLAFSGCTAEEESAPPEDIGNPFHTMDELAKHNSAKDCWLVFEGNIYDVTEYVVSHPGGEAILKGCGIDATEIFGSIEKHTDTANNMLEKYLLGPLTK